MLCFAIGIASATWFIYSFVIIGTLIGATIGGLTSFLFLCVSIVTSLGVTLGGLPGFFCYCVSIGILLDAALGGLTGFSFFCLRPWSWFLVLLLSCCVSMSYCCLHLVWFDFHLHSPSIMSVGWLLICDFWGDIK